MQFSIRIEDEQKEKWESYAQENGYDSLAELIRVSVEDTIRESESEVPSQLDEVLDRLETILPEIESIEAVVHASENNIIQEVFEEIHRLDEDEE